MLRCTSTLMPQPSASSFTKRIQTTVDRFFSRWGAAPPNKELKLTKPGKLRCFAA